MIHLTCATFLIGPPLCEKTMWDIKMKIIVHLPLEDAVFFLV